MTKFVQIDSSILLEIPQPMLLILDFTLHQHSTLIFGAQIKLYQLTLSIS